jgi:hypothetical protein
MKTLQIDEKKAKGLYENASPEYRAILEDTFGKDFFVSIQERVKSYEDACLELGLNPYDLPKVDNCEHEDRASIIAFYKLTIIARALNEGWTPNWQDPNQYKYYPWFKVANPTRFVYADTYSTATSAIADIGSRLCCKSEDLATYFGKQFEKLWAEYLLL